MRTVFGYWFTILLIHCMKLGFFTVPISGRSSTNLGSKLLVASLVIGASNRERVFAFYEREPVGMARLRLRVEVL